MTTVLASTDQVPALAEALEARRAHGLDRYDEWWNGVYRFVTGPTPEHGRLVVKLAMFLAPLAEEQGHHLAAPVNIGVDKIDARVPDLGVYHPDTPRTSPAFLDSAELVVEILSPDEPAGAKLDFYARVGVAEYLEVPLEGDVRLLGVSGGRWSPLQRSRLGFSVHGRSLTAGAGSALTL